MALGADGLHFVVFVDGVGKVASAESAGQFLKKIAHLLAVGLVMQRVNPIHTAVALKQVAWNTKILIFKFLVRKTSFEMRLVVRFQIREP